jgi:hypothetical protein
MPIDHLRKFDFHLIAFLIIEQPQNDDSDRHLTTALVYTDRSGYQQPLPTIQSGSYASQETRSGRDKACANGALLSTTSTTRRPRH